MIDEKIKNFAQTLTHSEREILKTIFSFSYTESHDKGSKETEDCLKILQKLQSRKDVDADGIAFVGDAGISSSLFDAINSESQTLARDCMRFEDHLVSTAGEIGKSFGKSEYLKNLVSAHVGKSYPTGKVNYLYYDSEGMGIKPHIDNDEFPINVIMMLEHESYSNSKSSLRFHLTDQSYKDVYLKPGELIIFFADTVVHERTPLSSGEIVRIAAFGYNLM
ncbi:conserved hypothetical protein [Vibrio nigripulchritudo SOn1]|uniref:Fe2OG dioxygenase domain-containing protein n=1 Tax=Vibrio nigripulchritudo SOn1 TaxID=1238450 RepID=A0AAV2VYC8_9VIBR|nr:2OG-Fe(II) oxygenase [Vibrio nigripulchritudo]CCO49774.1 conserved hypothetical protein [Vibrio nigripulchritudo SOn1]